MKNVKLEVVFEVPDNANSHIDKIERNIINKDYPCYQLYSCRLSSIKCRDCVLKSAASAAAFVKHCRENKQ